MWHVRIMHEYLHDTYILTIAWQYHDNTMRTWHLIMHFPPNDWSRRNENICQLLEKISVKTCKNICVRQLVPCTLSPRSGRRDGPPHLAGALRLSPACPGSWQWVGARCAGHPSPSRGYPAHSDTDGRHTQLFQVCFNHVIFQSLNSFGFFAYEYTSWWIYFNRNDKTLLLSGSMKIEQKSGRNMRI